MSGKGLTKTAFLAGIKNVRIDKTPYMQKQTMFPTEKGMVVVRDAPPVMNVMTLAIDYHLLKSHHNTLTQAGIQPTSVKSPQGEAFLSFTFMQDKFSGYESDTN